MLVIEVLEVATCKCMGKGIEREMRNKGRRLQKGGKSRKAKF